MECVHPAIGYIQGALEYKAKVPNGSLCVGAAKHKANNRDDIYIYI